MYTTTTLLRGGVHHYTSSDGVTSAWWLVDGELVTHSIHYTSCVLLVVVCSLHAYTSSTCTLLSPCMVVCTSTLHIHVESRESTTPSRAESVCTPLLFMSTDQQRHPDDDVRSYHMRWWYLLLVVVHTLCMHTILVVPPPVLHMHTGSIPCACTSTWSTSSTSSSSLRMFYL